MDEIPNWRTDPGATLVDSAGRAQMRHHAALLYRLADVLRLVQGSLADSASAEERKLAFQTCESWIGHAEEAAGDLELGVDDVFRTFGPSEIAVGGPLHGNGGLGGMSTIWEGMLGPTRVILKGRNNDGDSMFALKQEAMAYRRLRFPGLLSVLGIATLPNKGSMLVLERMQHDASDLVVPIRGRNDLVQRISIAIQVAETLAYIHTQEWMHRDIKPSNVMYTAFSTGRAGGCGIVTAKVADLGLACKYPTRGVCGTQNYMAPEVLGGDEYSYPADVFSLGISLMEILGGAYLEFYGGDPGPVQDNPLGPGGWYIYKWLVVDRRPVQISVSLQRSCPQAVALVSSMIHMDPRMRPTMVDVCGGLRSTFLRLSIPLEKAAQFWQQHKFGDFVNWTVFVRAACMEIHQNHKKANETFMGMMQAAFVTARCLLTDGVVLTEGKVVSVESFGQFVAVFCNNGKGKRWLEETVMHAALVNETGCFIGPSNRTYAERILEPGTFLLRFSERDQSTLVLSHRPAEGHKIGHPYVEHMCGASYRVDKCTAATIPELIPKLHRYGSPIKRVRTALPSIASMFTFDQ